MIKILGLILFLNLTIFAISSQWAGGFDISEAVRRWTVRATICVCSKVSIQSSVTIFLKPILVLTLTGNPFAPLIVASIISSANFGLPIKAEHAPFLTALLSGQPILISIPSNPSLAIIFAAR